MTQASNVLEPSATIRRRPQPPPLAARLLVLWGFIFVACIAAFVWTLVYYENPHARWDLKAPIIAIILANWGLLYWRAKVLIAHDTKVKNARGAVCLNCHSLLIGLGQEGQCPECGEAFTLAHIRDVWTKHTP